MTELKSSMGTKTLITLDKVSKSYPKINSGRSRVSALKSAFFKTPYTETHDIIQSISLTVKKGESLGIIGENGAGKSTLLKLISQVLKPSSGSITVDCRIAALLELGAGFHPEYSGLENIRMNASLSGLSSGDLKDKMQSIIDFADIGEYMYEPIKNYSSGMVVRLGFAMITALDPELLITDEVLAVGDESFQKKCIAWMQEYLANGGTLLLVSHGMYHIQKLCTNAVWIENGQIREYGNAIAVTQSYLNHHERKNAEKPKDKALDSESYAIKQLAIVDEKNNQLRIMSHQQTIIIKGQIHSPDGREPCVALGIVKIDGTPIFGINNAMSNNKLKRIDEKTFEFALKYPNCPLLPGEFLVKGHAMDPEALRLIDTYELSLTVQGNTTALGNVYLEHEWQN